MSYTENPTKEFFVGRGFYNIFGKRGAVGSDGQVGEPPRASVLGYRVRGNRTGATRLLFNVISTEARVKPERSGEIPRKRK